MVRLRQNAVVKRITVRIVSRKNDLNRCVFLCGHSLACRRWRIVHRCDVDRYRRRVARAFQVAYLIGKSVRAMKIGAWKIRDRAGRRIDCRRPVSRPSGYGNRAQVEIAICIAVVRGDVDRYLGLLARCRVIVVRIWRIIRRRHGNRHCRRAAQPLWVTHLIAKRVDPGKVGVWCVIYRVIRSPFHRSMCRRIDAITRKISKRVIRVGDRKREEASRRVFGCRPQLILCHRRIIHRCHRDLNQRCRRSTFTVIACDCEVISSVEFGIRRVYQFTALRIWPGNC